MQVNAKMRVILNRILNFNSPWTMKSTCYRSNSSSTLKISNRKQKNAKSGQELTAEYVIFFLAKIHGRKYNAIRRSKNSKCFCFFCCFHVCQLILFKTQSYHQKRAVKTGIGKHDIANIGQIPGILIAENTVLNSGILIKKSNLKTNNMYTFHCQKIQKMNFKIHFSEH